ncbi:aspartate carbamoyltransferase catalytic subunit [Oceanobacillus alkalisoli]|uniref:aspartate carbamoyltransferase catalytic subunit n=1 Tax=Oceanobacillus alkalisoli TaxID=2925113 RepID=UPI001F11C90A|nr:aspartate carbamoyltransferase catalytic subunit [Oceanobacillus alkalisoli]MCF3942499.1 aspartate carbamoyltransferase catalytic subunit [Oceanobacillus alkalisoli]
MRHFISVDQLTTEEIHSILEGAEKLRSNEYKLEQQLFAANLFFEPSTRTKMSFVVAERKLGIENLDFHAQNSAVLKGESLYDTAKTFEAIGADLLVVRHEDDDWYEELEGKMSIPLINGGAGAKEHPTQTMLDLLTIYQEFKKFKGLKIAIAGDIKHSRVARSNAACLQKLGAEVYLSAAQGMERDALEFPYLPIDEAVEVCDVVMLLRIQHERHEHSMNTYGYLKQYGLTKERESRMKDNAIIMHPAPINRGVEIDSCLVECERSRIFKQMNNGVYVRMAIIINLLKEWGILNEKVNEKYQTAI